MACIEAISNPLAAAALDAFCFSGGSEVGAETGKKEQPAKATGAKRKAQKPRGEGDPTEASRPKKQPKRQSNCSDAARQSKQPGLKLIESSPAASATVSTQVGDGHVAADTEHVVSTPSDADNAPSTPPVSGSATQKASTKKYRQANESVDGIVDVLCFSCRRSKDTTIQSSMMKFFKPKVMGVVDLEAPVNTGPVDPNLCSRCRKPMQEKIAAVVMPSERKGLNAAKSGAMPQLTRLKGYIKSAKNQGVAFNLSEQQACTIMRQDCILCGMPAPERGHGITRLRKWPEGMQRPEKGGFMGPFVPDNVATACSACNLMKGYRKLGRFVECARHIATHHTPGEDFGLYSHRFRDNVSKRARSGYITKSSTHTKTHAMTNEEFHEITAQRCFYCWKEPRKPGTLGPDDRGHFNGLDRLDSTNRLYATATVVACCGDCNIFKYRWPLEGFLAHVRAVARHHVGKEVADDTASESCDEDGLGEEQSHVMAAEAEDEEEAAVDGATRDDGGATG